MSPSATPATQSAAASPATDPSPSAPAEPAQCHKCQACHAKCRYMSPSARPAKVPWRHRRLIPAQARHQSQPSAISANPATRNEGGCRQVPRLPRKVPRRHRRLIPAQAPPEPAQCHKCHACHAKPATQSWAASPATKRAQARHHSQPSAISAMPATQNEGGCDQVPRVPRRTQVDVPKGHACHAKGRWMSPSATKVDAAKCHAVV